MKDRKIQWISGGVAALLLAAFLLLLLFATRQDLFSSRQMEVFSGDWTYRCGQAEGAGALPAKLDVPRGAEVEYTKKIPADADEDSAVVFRTRMQYVRVYVGDRLAYEFPEEKLIGVKITNAWNFVRLGPEDAGKEIRIVIRSPYRFCGGAIGQVFYGDFDDMVTTIISKQTKLSRASSLIGLSGIVILLISLLGSRYRLYSWHKNLGIMLLCLAFWLAGGAGLPSGMVGLEAWYYFSALSALAFPAFLAAYLYERWPGIWGKGTKGLFYLTLAYAAAALLSSLAGGPDLVTLGPVTAVAAGRVSSVRPGDPHCGGEAEGRRPYPVRAGMPCDRGGCDGGGRGGDLRKRGADRVCRPPGDPSVRPEPAADHSHYIYAESAG